MGLKPLIAGYLTYPDLKVGVIEKPDYKGLQPKKLKFVN
jgi:hypothetical protein